MTPIFNSFCRRALGAAVLLSLTSAAASAQSTGGPPANVRMRIGPIYINPTMALSNAGVDDNVFNDPASTTPTSDYTVTFSPKTDLWLRMGPSWLTGNIREDIVYFAKSASERSANSTYSLSWMIPLNRITLTPSGTYANTRDRPGFEIDARAARAEIGFALAAEVRAFSKTSLGVTIVEHHTLFAEGATFLNTNLHDELNRYSLSESVGIHHQLTPLTSLAIDLSRAEDRFTYEPLRNTTAMSIGAALKFDPAALIKGGASVGFTNFQPTDPSVPGYQGITAAVNMSYVFLSITKIGGSVERKVSYSYDVNQPYYIQSTVSADVGQQLFGPLDVVARGSLGWLDYRSRAGAIVLVPNRQDTVRSFGGGFGYHFGKDTRLGFNIDQENRQSAIDLRRYSGLKYGFSLTFGS